MAARERAIPDPRELRTSYEMVRTLEMETHEIENDSFYHQAQISFLLTGVDEWHWTAYCCVDTFFGSERTPEWYVDKKFDGLSAGEIPEFHPIWNPREYFLFVCSSRLSQATKEWRNAVLVLESRLNQYVRKIKNTAKPLSRLMKMQEVAYEREIQTGQFSYDKDFKKTTRYTWALSILRRFHDVLQKTLEAWEEFNSGELKYFATDSEILDRHWYRYHQSIFEDVSELAYLRRSLLQRIQTFDRMKDGVGLVASDDYLCLLTQHSLVGQCFGVARKPDCYSTGKRHWSLDKHDSRKSGLACP